MTSDEVLASFLNLAIDRYRVEIDAKQPSAEKQNSVTTIPQAFFFADEQESPLLGEVKCLLPKRHCNLGLVLLQKNVTQGGYPFIDVYTNDLAAEMEIITCGFPIGRYDKEKLEGVRPQFSYGVTTSAVHRIERRKVFEAYMPVPATFAGGPVFCLKSGKLMGFLRAESIGDSDCDYLLVDAVHTLFESDPNY